MLTIDQATEPMPACASLTASVAITGALLLPSASSTSWRKHQESVSYDPFVICFANVRSFSFKALESLQPVDRPTDEVIVDARLLEAKSPGNLLKGL